MLPGSKTSYRCLSLKIQVKEETCLFSCQHGVDLIIDLIRSYLPRILQDCQELHVGPDFDQYFLAAIDAVRVIKPF